MIQIIKGQQIIYGYLDKDISQRKIDGFQTILFPEKRMTDEDLIEIESRLFYIFKDKLKQESKYIFSKLKSGKYLLAKICPSKEYDYLGRLGKYFSHGLILECTELEKIDFNPFILFDSFKFFSNYNELLVNINNLGRGIIPDFCLEIDKSNQKKKDVLENIEYEDLYELLDIIGMSEELIKTKKSICLIGSSEEVYKILKRTFCFLPVSLRASCTFDSYFEGGVLSKNYYFIIGVLSAEKYSDKLIYYDIKERRLLTKIEAKPETPFQIWWNNVLKRKEIKKLILYGESAIKLNQILLSNEPIVIDLDRIDDIFYLEYFNLNKKYFLLKTKMRIEKDYGENISEIFSNLIREWLYNEGKRAIEKIRKEFPKKIIVEWAKNLYKESIKPVPEMLIIPLKKLSKCIELKWLYFRCLRWEKNWEDLSKYLINSNFNEFYDAIEWALKTINFEKDMMINQEINIDEENEIKINTIIKAKSDKGSDEIKLIKSLFALEEERKLFKSKYKSNLDGKKFTFLIKSILKKSIENES